MYTDTPPKMLTIKLPKEDHAVMQERYHINKQVLVYLHSPNCRKYMTESERLQNVKLATERFQKILMYKAFNPF